MPNYKGRLELLMQIGMKVNAQKFATTLKAC